MFASQFENEEQGFKTKKTSIALLVTVLFHALILLLFIFTILREPDPPLSEMEGGMTVNFGTDEVGTGDEQPFTYNPGETPAAATAPAESQPVDNSPEKVLTQDNPETDVSVPKAENDKPKPKVNDKTVFKKHPKTSNNTTPTTATTEAPVTAPEPKPNANAMFSKGAYGKPNNSKGDGTGGGQGDQGKPDGDPNSRNYLGDGGEGTGKGKGVGPGAYLKGRKNTTLPAPNNCSSQGSVVIAIKVDKSGKVIDASFKRFASTAVDDCNINNAIIAARKATFNPDPNAPDVQEGTITYIYKVH